MGKSAAPGLVNDRLVVEWVELGDDIMAGFTTDQESTLRPLGSDSKTGRVVLGPKSFSRRKGGKIGTMTWLESEPQASLFPSAADQSSSPSRVW